MPIFEIEYESKLSKILIIDDEEKLRTLLARIISLEGFDVAQAADSKTALKKMEQAEIDVVLCDVKLPDGNGVELYRDRPMELWPRTADGGLAMFTRALDLEGLLGQSPPH